MNLVTLHAVLRKGLEYPLFYRIWRKPEVKGEGPTKLDLAQEMLVQLRKSVHYRLWVAMDRWYLAKEFFNFLVNWDWGLAPPLKYDIIHMGDIYDYFQQ